MRKIRIEQAFYGERRGGHSLLAYSGEEQVAIEIVQRLDLPDTAPPGVEWSPFLRGFPHQDTYVLSRTLRDTAASRTGMVFSHALLARLEEIAEMPDLRPLLKLLATSDRQRPNPASLELVPTELPLPQSNELPRAAEALGINERLPVVRFGHVGFDDLIVALWARLFPEVRKGFAFRLSFDPRDLVDTPMPALVCTPQSMSARWSDYPVIRSAVLPELVSFAGAVLSGHAKATPLLRFMQQIGSKPATFRELRLLEKAYLLNMADATLERRIGAVRLIDMLSPDPQAGQDKKDVLLGQLCALIPAARPEEILLLRNLEVSAFRTAGRVWKALHAWAAKNKYAKDQDFGILSVLKDATTSTAAVRPWRTAVLDGLAVATRSRKASVFDAFWRWASIRPEIVTAWFDHLSTERVVDQRLALATPDELEEKVTDTVLPLLVSRGWLITHGAVLSAVYDPIEAVRRQVAEDTNQSNFDGLRLAIRHASGSRTLECAMELEDPRVLQLGAEAVAKKPELLAGLDLSLAKAQAIWRQAILIDAKCWQGPSDPAAAFHRILDGLLDAGEADRALIDLLVQTPLADLGSYARRSEVWSRIAGASRQIMLVATANEWLRRVSETTIPFRPGGRPSIFHSRE